MPRVATVVGILRAGGPAVGGGDEEGGRRPARARLTLPTPHDGAPAARWTRARRHAGTRGTMGGDPRARRRGAPRRRPPGRQRRRTGSGGWRPAAGGGANRLPRGHPTAAAARGAVGYRLPSTESTLACCPPPPLRWHPGGSFPPSPAAVAPAERTCRLRRRGDDGGADDARQGPFACPPPCQPPGHRWSARGAGVGAPRRAPPPSPHPKRSPWRGPGLPPFTALLAVSLVGGGTRANPRGLVRVAAAVRRQQGYGYVAAPPLSPLKGHTRRAPLSPTIRLIADQ